MEHNLWRIFAGVSAAVAERECVVWRDVRQSYGELAGRATRVANLFRSHGLGVQAERGSLKPWEAGQDMIGVYLLNGPEFIEATLGGYASRTAPFNVNYRYVADELAYLLNDASAKGLVYHARFAPTLAEVLPRLREAPRLLLQVADESGNDLLPGALDYEAAVSAASPVPVPDDQSPDDLYVVYTGGTTGMPKGTLWRQADIWIAALGGDLIGEDSDLETVVAAGVAASGPRLPGSDGPTGNGRTRPAGGPRVLLTAPLMHAAGHWLAFRTLLGGGTLVMNSVVDRLDPVDVWTLVEREKIEMTAFVGEAFARPVMAEFEKGTYDASSLRFIGSGGAVTSPETKERILTLLPHAVFADVAGASETGGGLTQISTAAAKPLAGIFQPGPTSAVLDAGLTRRLTPADETVGWFAKSGRLPLGYLGDQTKTAETFRVVDGVRWSVPGDRARLTPDGSVELLGRESMTISSGGEKIFAEEVEAAVLTHPDVVDVIVVGRPSERWGQEVVAVVELTPGADLTDADLVQAASTRIARFKLPKTIVRVPKVLRSPAGKADYGWARKTAVEFLSPSEVP